ncbi:MAG: cyclic nucleotide-binding domain-containing protein [bacterium]|nr:cyclic nucleotide-binding domain-containing protein [bacterium]
MKTQQPFRPLNESEVKRIVFRKALPWEIQIVINKLQGSYEFFREMTEFEIGEILKLCKRVTFESGRHIFRKGETGTSFYFIVSGEVIIRLGEKEVARLKPGEIFGEMGILEDAPRNATACAGEKTILLAISKEILENEDPAVGYKVAMGLLRQLSQKLREADRQLNEKESPS